MEIASLVVLAALTVGVGHGQVPTPGRTLVNVAIASTTACVADFVSKDPRLGTAHLNVLITDAFKPCAGHAHELIEFYDRYYGTGEGEIFFEGPYLDRLPKTIMRMLKITP
jgi:hypothetical protein